MKILWFIIPAVLLLILAAFFRFALIGYAFLAFILVALAGLLLLYAVALRLKNRRLRKVLCWVLNGLVILSLLMVIAGEIPVILGAKTDEDPGADYLIVLGAGLNGTVPSLSLADRLHAALDYLEKHPESVAILSGGQGSGEDISEAEAMRRWLISRGVTETRLILEDQSTSTKENLQYSKPLIPEGASVAVCSGSYHLYRARQYAAKLGYGDVKGVAASSSLPLIATVYYIRESFAVWYMWVFG